MCRTLQQSLSLFHSFRKLEPLKTQGTFENLYFSKSVACSTFCIPAWSPSHSVWLSESVLNPSACTLCPALLLLQSVSAPVPPSPSPKPHPAFTGPGGYYVKPWLKIVSPRIFCLYLLTLSLTVLFLESMWKAVPCRGPVTIVTRASKGKERGATFLVGLLRKAAICVFE